MLNLAKNGFLSLHQNAGQGLFGAKNFEKAYFNQPLECTAPKRWWKYTKLKPFGRNQAI